ncbi:hypothetical protein SK128_024313, partial [Halocaridina rubra]
MEGRRSGVGRRAGICDWFPRSAGLQTKFSAKNHDQDHQDSIKKSKKRGMEAATNSSIDKILIDETKVIVSEVVEQLYLYGLATKPPEPLEGGTALGLRLERGKN